MLPEKALRKTTASEVPTACWGVKPKPTRSSGTIIHPPPAPIRVPRAPMPSPDAKRMVVISIRLPATVSLAPCRPREEPDICRAKPIGPDDWMGDYMPEIDPQIDIRSPRLISRILGSRQEEGQGMGWFLERTEANGLCCWQESSPREGGESQRRLLRPSD